MSLKVAINLEGKMASVEDPCQDEEGCPLKLIESKANSFKLNEKTLRAVVNNIGHLPACILSICGPAQHGKSLLLGYIIRYLEGLERGEGKDWMKMKKPLKGFKFRKNSETFEGIWIWSKPFIVKDEAGKEIAVILLDTQNGQDEFTVTRESTAILGLGLLASSSTILNNFKNIQDETFLTLNTFMEYGKLALEELGGDLNPFQNLTFLIRDWTKVREFAYGESGGRSFLLEKLKNKQKRSIEKCFKELNCFLLPNIGEKALTPNFNGFTADLSPTFATQLEKFITSLKFTPKENMGRTIVASDLKLILTSYLEIFNSNALSPTQLWEASCKLADYFSLHQAKRRYSEVFTQNIKGKEGDNEEVEKAHFVAKTHARDSFRKERKFGDRFKAADLESLIKEERERLLAVKDVAKDKSNRLIEESVKAAVEDFLMDMNEAFPLGDDNVYQKDTVKSKGERVKSLILHGLKETYSGRKEDVKSVLKAVEQALDKELSSYLDKLKPKPEPVDKEMEVIFKKAVKEYNEKMKSKMNDPEVFILPPEFAEFHKQAVNAAIMTLDLSVEQREKVFAHLNDIKEIYWKTNIMNLNSLKNGAPAIGIDLGTTYCCVAIFLNGKVKIIPDVDNGSEETFPSYVAFREDGEEIVGKAAKDLAYMNPEYTIYDAKRIIGRNINDPELQEDMKYWPFTVEERDGTPKLVVHDKALLPQQISAKLLTYCRTMAEKYLGLGRGDIKKAVITVPAYFNDGQRQATVDAGKVAGLEVLTILNEPTAAAIAYSLDRLEKTRKKILVFDLGGGTFDVAVLDMSHANTEVLAVNGDCHLGGEDFDRNMMKYCAEQFKKKHGLDLFDGKDSAEKQLRDKARRRLKRLQTKCEESKRHLTSAKSVTVSMDSIMDGEDLVVEVTRMTFEDLNQVYFQKTIDLVKDTLREKGIPKGDIDDIVLVGGSSKIPKVRDMLSDFFDQKALNIKIHPDHSIAYGAAVQAALMNGEERARNALDVGNIQDVTPMSIGVEKMSKRLGVIIPKNAKVPGKWNKVFKTGHDNLITMRITIFQGENLEVAARNKKLGEFELSGIPPAKARKEEVDVEMEIDSMGILHVTATSKSNQGIKNKLTIKEDNKNRLSDATINKLQGGSGQ